MNNGKQKSVKYYRLRILLLCAVVFYLCVLVISGLCATPRASDLAVVLGNEVLANGKPSPRLQARLDCAVNIFRRHLAPRILVSGGKGKSGFDEATVMKAYLVSQGVPESAVLVDSEGVNTAATAINTMSLARRQHWNDILIVTQYYHIPRCMLAFHNAGLRSLSADYPRYFEPMDIFAILREGVAYPVYFAKISGKE